MFTFYGLQEVRTVTLPDKKEGARIANIYCRVVGLLVELHTLLKLSLIMCMRAFLWVFIAVHLLSNRKPSILKDCTAEFDYGGQKRIFIGHERRILWAVFNRQMSCSKLTMVKQELSSNLLVPYAFACQVLVWSAVNYFLSKTADLKFFN